MTIVYLIRHGQASAGTDDYDRLSALGQRQATLLGEHWQRLNIKPDAAFAGSLKRQQHTAQLVLEASKLDLPIQQLNQLDEYNHTHIDELFAMGKKSDDPGGLTFDEYHATMARWRDAESQEVEGYESFQTFENRGIEAIQAACSKGHSSVALFTSGGIVATVLKQALGKDFTHTMKSIWNTRNSSVTTLQVDGQSASTSTYMVDYNTVSHLEYHSDRSLITLI